MRMRGGAGGIDLSKVPTEELMRMKAAPPSFAAKVGEVLEPLTVPAQIGTSLLTGTLGTVIGGVAGIGKGLFGGKYGTPEGAREAQATAGEVAHALTYQPRSPMAQEGMATIGSLLDKSKLAGIGPSEAVMMNALPATQAARGVVTQGRNAAQTVGSLIQKSEPEMAGGGAAVTEGEAMRRARAQSLPVPVNLSKGEASRNFEQQRFEREKAKEGSAAGDILRKHGADENLNLTKNLEWFLDESGATAPTARVGGGMVDDALRSRSDFMKGKYRDAYKQAKAAGETAELIDTAPLLQYLSQKASAKGMAGVLGAVEDEAVRLGGATRTEKGILFSEKMSVNDIEDMRKMAVKLGKKDETNAHFAKEINGVIDQMTENAGGKHYREARQLFKEHADEFKNQGAIKKLLGTKPGTTDRSVAYEDVFKHSILTGSMDDTVAIFRSLEQAGPKGKQAIAELKGSTMQYLQEQAERNSVRDVNGNKILSNKGLDSAVRELEKDGKLEFMFGKQGAQQIRDITDIIGDLNVAPAGVVNTSGTAAVLKEALGAALTGRVPTAVAKTVQGIKGAVGEYRDTRLAREALAPPEGPHVVH